ncbi:MAG: hypothetical protein P1U74_09800 [Legionellaceae bacterium]|nr:hypothetical protein [Legionellaceae bacterium]
MHVVYLICEIDGSKTNEKLAAWDVMTRFNRSFGEVSGTVVTAAQPDESFVMKMKIHDIDKLDGISQAKLNTLVNQLKRECAITTIEVHKETSEEKELFEELETEPSAKPETRVSKDEDLGKMVLTELKESPKTVINNPSDDEDEGEKDLPKFH